jgi:uncharacterized RDD family membrane protein YckC
MADDAPLKLDGTHTVLTPEYVEFTFVLAGLMSRFFAWFIDALVALGITLGLGVAAALLEAVAGGVGAVLALVGYFVINWGYMTFLEVIWSGQTLGKRVMGLRVISETGVRVTPLQSLLRNLARLIDSTPAIYLVGGLTALFSRSQQRLGDLIAGTIVVRERRLKVPSALAQPEGDTSLLHDADFRARVARLTQEEEAACFSASLRREELGMEARLTLFSALAGRLEDELGIIRPEHLSDEKLVLLVTAALAARNAGKRGKKAQK